MQTFQLAAQRAQAEQLASVASSFLRLRPRLLAPAGPLLLYLLYVSRIPTIQLICIAGNFLAMMAFFTWEALHLRGKSTSAQGFARSLMLTIAGLSSVCAFSGGASSPFLPILFAPIGIGFAAFGAGRYTARILVVLAIGIVYLALAQLLFPWRRIASPYVEAMTLLGTLLSTTLLYFGVTGLASAYRGTRHALQSVRAELLDAAQKRANELQSLGAEVAHEIKNPLASVKGLVSLMHERLCAPSQARSEPRAWEPDDASSPQITALSGRESERFKQRLGVVLQEVSRMERVLTEYLDFARPLAALRPRPVQLQVFLAQLGDLLGGQAEQLGVDVNVSCPELSLEIDPERLQQALLNLSQNALLAMQAGGRLTLAASMRSEEVCISVTDTGPGIAAGDLARIKQPYFSKRAGGTGLGVVIADAIIAQHGGRLSYESELGVGTQAQVTLPLRRDADR